MGCDEQVCEDAGVGVLLLFEESHREGVFVGVEEEEEECTFSEFLSLPLLLCSRLDMSSGDGSAQEGASGIDWSWVEERAFKLDGDLGRGPNDSLLDWGVEGRGEIVEDELCLEVEDDDEEGDGEWEDGDEDEDNDEGIGMDEDSNLRGGLSEHWFVLIEEEEQEENRREVEVFN